MHRHADLSEITYGSISPRRPLEKTAKVIASEVAIGENTYYGSIRPIKEGPEKKIVVDDVYVVAKNELDSAEGKTKAVMSDWTCGNERCYDDHQLVYAESPLPLQLFISSLSDALSYTSVDTTTGTADFRFNDNGGPAQGSSVLHVTPMGSTTKLISSDTSSTFKLPFCGTKCLSIFGTLFMTISLTASLGNILRLPTTVFLHGGGTFLVAYICITLLLGIPLTFLEITLGQFCQQGTTKLWRAVPLFKGIGVVKLLSCVVLCLYYPIFIVNTVFYTIWSLYQPLSTSQCFTKLLPSITNHINSPEFREDAFNKLCSKNETFSDIINDDIARFGIEFSFLLIVWIFVLLCVMKNGNSLRISSCIIVPCAMFVTITLFIEGVHRNTKGMQYLVTNIKWSSLWSFDIWYTALIQFFFSSHVGLGNITTCAGRLYPKNNPFWTSICYIFLNLAIGISFVCVLYMWVEDLMASGNVVHMPETEEMFLLPLIYDVMSRCYGKFAQLWAVMAYTLIILSGFISIISLVYTLIVGITVETKNKWNWWHVSSLVCGICFIGGCCCMLPNFNIIRLLDHYVIGKLIITTTVLEVMAFVWFYGLESLSNDFEFVLGYKLNTLWKTLWFSIPIALSLAEVWSWFYLPGAHNAISGKSDSVWFAVIGWIIYLFAWLTIVAIAAWQVFSQVDYNFSQKFVSSTKPTRNWGPVDPIYRHCWIQWKKQYQTTGERDFTLRRRGTRDYTHSVKRGRHAGPVGMRYSVNPSSNQNTLEHKKDNDSNRLQYSYDNNNEYRHWANSDFHFTTNSAKPAR